MGNITRQVFENPFKDINKVLVIAGSDKRGTIYGMFIAHPAMGVSPGMVGRCSVIKKEHFYIKPGIFRWRTKVKYREFYQ
jgi:hypothetical protein